MNNKSNVVTQSLDIAEIDTRARWQQRPPKEFPSPWASEWGFDDYGLWQTLLIPTGNGKNVPYKMRFIARGEFMMGSPENEKGRNENEVQHKVTLTQGFWLGETTVTQALWQAVMPNNASSLSDESEDINLPVTSVSWLACYDFCNVLNEKISGLSLTLPTETQWEYACRAGTQTAFSMGDNLTASDANFDNSEGRVAAHSYRPNTWGLYQMHGNVWEWCQDAFQHYGTADAIDPVNQSVDADENTPRVLRGGSWRLNARRCRSAHRDHFRAGFGNGNVGLRVAQVELASTHAGEAAHGTIDPPRSKGDVTSDGELVGNKLVKELNNDKDSPSLTDIAGMIVERLADNNSAFIDVLEEMLVDHVAQLDESDIVIDADFYGEFDTEFLTCTLESFDYVYDNNGAMQHNIAKENDGQIVITLNVLVEFNAQASFSFSVRDSIDKDYVSLSDSIQTVTDSFEARALLTLDRETAAIMGMSEIDIDELLVTINPVIIDVPDEIHFGSVFPYSQESMDDIDEEEE